MKTATEWISTLSDAGETHPAACICLRCKEGREVFILEGDITQIQVNALQWAEGKTADELKRAITEMSKFH